MIYSDENIVPSQNSLTNSLENKITTNSENDLTESLRLKLIDFSNKHVCPFGDISNIRVHHDEFSDSSGIHDFIGKCSGYKFVSQSRNEPFKRSVVPNHKKHHPSLNVPCLQPVEELRQMCQELGLIFVDCSNYGKTYEVDLLFDDSFEEGQTYYLVKWKGYASNQNTWEPESNLIGCQDLIKHYKALKRSDINLKDIDINFFLRELLYRKPYDMLAMRKLCGLLMGTSHENREILQLRLTDLRNKAKEIHNLPPSKLAKLKKPFFELMKFSEARKKMLISLKEWEEEINACNPSAYIEVENNADLEEPPSDFKFIHDYITTDIEISEEPLAFCQCVDCYKCKRKCCPNDSEAPFAYTIHRRLQLLPGYPIYECNKRCKCGPDCINRVVQHGQKIKVSIFRTSNGCGWGLKTLETIQKDQFVLEYLGEILTSEAAEARGKIYDYVGRSYLFDLDYNSENNLYTIDAGHQGNAAHFINHSCDPNLHVFAVWINQPDPYLPRLAFFAKRKIEKGQELTFDYKMVKNSERFESSDDLPVEERIPCRCNSKKCRKFLF